MRLLALAAVLALAGPTAAAVPPAAVTVKAASGQAYEGTIGVAGDVHSFLLEDFHPMTFSISLKAGKGSALLPDIALYDPADADITGTLAAFRRDGAKSVSVKNAPALASGRHVLQVKGKTSTVGTYLLKVTAKVVKTYKGTGLVPAPLTTTFPFFAPTEATVSLKVVKGAGSTLVPAYVSVAGNACAPPRLVPSATLGLASFVSPVAADYTVEIGGNGGTGGTFSWIAKVKPVKPSRKPVRVNGGAPYFADPGPAPAILTAKPGQKAVGFAVDALGLCWREVRTTGGGPNAGKNSIQASTLTGAGVHGLAGNFVADVNPPLRAFALGPTHAATYAGGSLWSAPRAGGGEIELASTTTVLRLLADDTYALALRSNGITRYNLDGSDAQDVLLGGGLTYLDMALGGIGIVFAATNGSGDLVISMVDRDGGGLLPLATISPDPGFFRLTARGPDVYFAVDNGNGGSSLYRASACDPGNAVPLCPDFSGKVLAMACDELNAYAVEDDATDGIRIRQVPRSGGESFVILRENPNPVFNLGQVDLGAAGGYVFVQGDTGGNPDFYRLKRR